jgi:hypothetical protein
MLPISRWPSIYSSNRLTRENNISAGPPNASFASAIISTLRQQWNEARASLCAFDLLELARLDMRREPIETRNAKLASIGVVGALYLVFLGVCV